jgi:Proliferating cell nuclear antigen, N-terminal domain
MFEARIRSTEPLRAVILDLKKHCTQFVLDCSDTGVSVKVQSQTSRSVIAEVFLSARFFDAYQCAKTLSFVVDSNALLGILKWQDDKKRKISCLAFRANGTGSLALSLEGDDGRVVVLYGLSWLLCVLTCCFLASHRSLITSFLTTSRVHSFGRWSH